MTMYIEVKSLNHTILSLIRGYHAPHSVTIFFSVYLMILQINELHLQLDP